MKKITIRERKLLEGVFAAIEANLTAIAKDGMLSVDAMHDSLSMLYKDMLETPQGTVLSIGRAHSGKTSLMGVIKMNTVIQEKEGGGDNKGEGERR